jgi:hypothetical protein
MFVPQMALEYFLIGECPGTVTLKKSSNTMLPKFMLGPTLSSGERGERISTSIKGADVWLQVLEHVDSAYN